MAARLGFSQHERIGPDEYIEIEVWEVPESRRFPAGTKFSFVYLSKAGGGRVYGVDNHHGIGPHEHNQGTRRPIDAEAWQHALDHFWRRLREIRGH